MRTLNRKNFRNYGRIIEYPDKAAKGTARNLWHIVHSDPFATGWRAAYLVLRDRTIGRLECHPESDEAFVPVRGRALLFVARAEDPGNIECFRLDKAVIINKGVWHGLVTLTAETEFMIFENARVSCLYRDLGRRVRRMEDLGYFGTPAR